MKKNVLALSITAAVAAIGFAGSAQAIGLNATGNPVFPGNAVNLRASVDGIGHFLYVPYYTAQGNNNTMINLVNTDTVNAKAVKVRFRAAANSDDVFDFQVFLSPGDVWTASVKKDALNQARLYTADASCTKPEKGDLVQPVPTNVGESTGGTFTLNGTPFQTVRLDQTKDVLNEAREGYVEIFNMANIPPLLVTTKATNPLFTAVKHVNNVAPCRTTVAGAAALDALNIDPIDSLAAFNKGLDYPTSGLFANWIILNAADAGAWSAQAPAIVAIDETGKAGTGALAYFPQTNEPLSANAATRIAAFTADPWLRTYPSLAATYDLPDFSIPYTALDPAEQAHQLNFNLATRSITNEFLTSSAINATTDWVLSMPTRRYSTAFDYTYVNPVTKEVGRQLFTVLPFDYFTPANTAIVNRQICVTGTSITSYNQEETTAVNPGADIVISPQVPGKPTSFYVCGEASVLAFNNGGTTAASGTFKSTVARSAIENGYSAGWSILTTPGILDNGLPILGYEAVRATAGTAAFGATLGQRTDRVNK